MRMSPVGLALLKSQEGCVLHVYHDDAGIPTIGWGHARWSGASPITQAQADALLVEDLRPCEACVNAHVSAETTQGAFDAFVDFAYNCGVGALLSSSALRCLNAGNLRQAALDLLLWDKIVDPHTGAKIASPVLQRRRLAEAVLLYGSDPTVEPEEADDVA